MTGRVWILWLLFLVRGAFYCTMLPLWEGWDEYAHFAWLEHWNTHHTLPEYTTPVSREIEASLELTPVTEELKWMGPGHFTHEQWWALPPSERADRQTRLAALQGDLRGASPTGHLVFYEAQQPPLYYWLAAIPENLAARWPLHDRVILVRLFSLLIASAVIPLVWFSAKACLGEPAASLCAALLAITPALAIDTSRVANDSLAIALAALVLLLLVKRAPYWALGLALGAALLAKPYLLSLLPAVILLRRREAVKPILIALALAGWWYIRNVTLGYSFSGWLDRAPATALLAAVTQVNWLKALNVTAKSFLWFGAWSFLTLKSWAYILLEAAGLAGFILALRRPEVRIAWPMAGFHILAMAYGVLVYYAAHQIGNLPGWYLWPMAAPLALLLVAGLRRWTALLILLLGIADIYGAAALMLPYYSGFVVRNRANASVWNEALHRLHTPIPLAAAWLLATLVLIAIAAYICARNQSQTPPETPSSNPAT